MLLETAFGEISTALRTLFFNYAIRNLLFIVRKNLHHICIHNLLFHQTLNIEMPVTMKKIATR